MTELRNTPTGWDAFRVFRQTPAPVFQFRHGNWKHGYYSKQSIAAAREATDLVYARRAARRFAHMPSPRPAPGWLASRAARVAGNFDDQTPALVADAENRRP